MPDRIRYYVVKRGRAFWMGGKFAAQYHLPKCQPLGPDGPEAKKLALEWTARLDEARAAARAPAKHRYTHPPGSLGHFYEVFRTKTAWRLMEPRTREDYERAWPEIEKRFGRTLVTKITADDSERFHAEIHPAHNEASPFSWNEAHRILKIWRALLSALASYEIRAVAPIGRVSNPSPKGRTGIWRHDDVMTLAWAAALAGHKGMAVAIRIAWDAMLAPVDVRCLTVEQWRAGASGRRVATQRAKTGKRVFHAVTADTAAIVDAYLAELPDVLPGAPLIRRPNGKAYTGKDTFGDDFRLVRSLVFPGDQRQFLDLRRSAATEARLGGATRDDLGKAMANRIDESEALAETYLLDASERVLEARVAGRSKVAAGANQ